MVDASFLLQHTGACALVTPPGAHGSLTERPLLQALQQGLELPALGGVERRQHLVAYLTPQRAHLLPPLTRAGAELEQGRPPVTRVGPPHEQPFLFESVDKVRHGARGYPELR